MNPTNPGPWVVLLEQTARGKVQIIGGGLLLIVDGVPVAKVDRGPCPVGDVLRLGRAWSEHRVGGAVARCVGEV